MYRTPRVIYFDLGNVILHFSHARMCQQVAESLNVAVEPVRQYLFSHEVHFAYESGRITTAEILEELNRRFSGQLTMPEVHRALGDIFSLNTAIVPLITGLKSAGWRLGILSNTCEAHWLAANEKFAVLRQLFDLYVLSFEVKTIKPFPEIYQHAQTLADCSPREMFFVDDLLENVEGARMAGWDAVLFTNVSSLIQDLLRRQVRFRY